jgi:hypothetical protein
VTRPPICAATCSVSAEASSRSMNDRSHDSGVCCALEPVPPAVTHSTDAPATTGLHSALDRVRSVSTAGCSQPSFRVEASVHAVGDCRLWHSLARLGRKEVEVQTLAHLDFEVRLSLSLSLPHGSAHPLLPIPCLAALFLLSAHTCKPGETLDGDTVLVSAPPVTLHLQRSRIIEIAVQC